MGHHGLVTIPSGPAHGVGRGLRAAVLGVVAVGLAEAAHASSDGCISLSGLMLALGLCWPAAVAVLGRRRTLPSLLGWLVFTQGVLHLLLESQCQEVVSGQQTLLAHLSVPPSGRQLLAHGLAVLVSAVLLSRADAQLWVVVALRRAVRLVVRLLVVPVPVGGQPLVARAVLPVRDVWRGPRPTRRGPPALCAP